ncbi:MAG TPA: tetratricopeptide repeat protein, partial [Phycisphaerae bacterium]
MDPVRHAAPGLRPSSARLRTRWLALLAVVCVLVALVHWPVLTKQALSVDDGEYLTNNPLVQHPSWESARRFLSEVLEPSTVHGYYQPLTMISLMLDHALGGRPNDLRVFHRTSLALHVVNTALVIVLLYQLFGNAWAAALAGLLFGAHPLTVEPIAWVADRKTLLAGFFALSCLSLYTRYAHAETRQQDAGATAGAAGRRRYSGYCAALLLFILALLSKPTSTPLPLLLLILDWWPLRRLNLRALIEKIPFLVVASVSAVITVISQARTGVVSVPTAHSWMRVPLLLAHNIVFYLYKLLWPAKLSSHYPFPEPVSLAQPMVLAGVIGTLVIVAALVISLRWTRSVLAGFLFFFIAILPSMGVLGFTNVVAADKHAYLPMIGWLLPLTYGICRLWSAARARPRRAGVVGTVCVLVLGEGCAVRWYLPKWKDSETLFRHMIALAPNAPLPHYGLGTVLKEQRRFNDAAAEYMAALQLKPDYADAHNNLGLALAGLGRNDEAIDHYRQAVRIKPDHADAQTNLGHALLLRGEADEAIEHYRAAVQSRARDARAHMNLGMALRQGGQLAHA